jgi:DNA-binding transcriptional regulator YiaG
MAVSAATKSQVKTFVSMLKKLKIEAKIESASDFAELIGVKSRTLRSWMSGQSQPSVESITTVIEELQNEQVFFDLRLRALNNALVAVPTVCK